MKRYYAAAGALLLGSSAFALAADTKTESVADLALTTEAKAEFGWDQNMVDAKSAFVAEPAAKTQLAASDKPTMADWEASRLAKLGGVQTASFDKPEASDATGKFQAASADWSGKPALLDGSDKLQTASADWSGKPSLLDGSDKVQTASADWSGKPAAETGMGGPLDEAEFASATMTPQPAAQNYPPCSPGPGDDRCIQLYEPGVRDQLASWNRPTGGLLDERQATAMGGPFEPAMSGKPAEAELASVYKPEVDSAAAAMGGPYEPVDETKPAEAELASVYKPADHESAELTTHGDGFTDLAAGETSDTELAATTAAVPVDLVQHDGPAAMGIGGPIESATDYPPCSPGPGDDRCIQLYEAGVSGAGN